MERFEDQVRATPQETAVICGRCSITYSGLDQRADEIASLLHARGIGRGSIVGMGLPRSLDLPAALLGIIRSGATYVPLDPSYPDVRLEQMIAAAGLETVVTHTELAERFPMVHPICLDDGTRPSPSPRAQDSASHQDDRIYAIFTSGSTGQPKAATVYHRGFENLLHWYASELTLGPGDRTLVISSPSFDLTQKNFFAPLMTGGTLILDEGQAYDITRITCLIRDHGITLINCTPSAFYPLVDAAAIEGYTALSTLRFAILGGEPVSISRLRAWLEHPNCAAEVVNSYGPTECTDICAFHRLHRENFDDFSFIPLGQEIPNVQISIVDAALSPLPDGAIGELCISGAGLGGGYLNDPVRTDEVFTGSVYRTGDLAKRHPCGRLEFRGRADHQVKVNGFRIELGEIEIAINHHPSVRESIVIASHDRLIGYVIGTIELPTLRAHLANRLPAYMIPGELVRMDQFPLTPNGKVDRRALEEGLERTTPKLDSGVSMESRVLALWSEVLERGIDDATANFFDLGGNSIHVAILHIRLMQMTGRVFPITELFALPNARSIAEFLSPSAENTATDSVHDRARRAQAALTRIRRPSNR